MASRKHMLPGHGSPALFAALAAVEQMQADNLILVPQRPTAAMLKAGARATGLSPHMAAALYAAMLTAADGSDDS